MTAADARRVLKGTQEARQDPGTEEGSDVESESSTASKEKDIKGKTRNKDKGIKDKKERKDTKCYCCC